MMEGCAAGGVKGGMCVRGEKEGREGKQRGREGGAAQDSMGGCPVFVGHSFHRRHPYDVKHMARV